MKQHCICINPSPKNTENPLIGFILGLPPFYIYLINMLLGEQGRRFFGIPDLIPIKIVKKYTDEFIN